MSTLWQKSATVTENGDCRRKVRLSQKAARQLTATFAEFGDSRTFLRQCGQAFTMSIIQLSNLSNVYAVQKRQIIIIIERIWA